MTLQTVLNFAAVYLAAVFLICLFFHCASVKDKKERGSRYWDKH